MISRRRVLAALALAPLAARAQVEVPDRAWDGKDVMWVPTPDDLVDRMLAMARVGPDDFVIDLGSGDGRIAIAAARRFGARALGIEFEPELVEIARREAAKAGVAARVRFAQGDFFEADFSQATVLTLYLLTSINLKLRPKILALAPGTRVVSHAFGMGDWLPDATARVGNHEALLWIVPARVGGAWRLPLPGGEGELRLAQQHQRVSGTARFAGRESALRGELDGERIRIELADGRGVRQSLSGRVEGAAMRGRAAAGEWRAERLGP
ncbi:MAG: class I SAM-dependent methyltransferase [Burkholderiales bacterium]|nr:class I SAM-dependent methyltransferase [Burkholderiales bacterium]